MGLFQKPPTGSFFLFYILVLVCFFEYETIVGSGAWSFGHSDPYPSSVYCIDFWKFRSVQLKRVPAHSYKTYTLALHFIRGYLIPLPPLKFASTPQKLNPILNSIKLND